MLRSQKASYNQNDTLGHNFNLSKSTFISKLKTHQPPHIPSLLPKLPKHQIYPVATLAIRLTFSIQFMSTSSSSTLNGLAKTFSFGHGFYAFYDAAMLNVNKRHFFYYKIAFKVHMCWQFRQKISPDHLIKHTLFAARFEPQHASQAGGPVFQVLTPHANSMQPSSY